MKVLKFGGTSVGTPESLSNVRAIVEGETERCVVVVSALGGLTDRLIATAEMAAAGDDSFLAEFNAICARHEHVCTAVIAKDRLSDALTKINALLDELGTVFKAIRLLRELTERSRDLVVSYGERMSCLIVTAMISGAKLAHSLDFIRTHRVFGKNVLDAESTSTLIADKFSSLRGERTVIVPGFIARDADGHIANLGRGGSDYTAAIIAAELGATTLEIWTDVDGFMSADPRIVKDARVIDRLTFVDAMELCNFGAKVVYPPTIYPVFHKNIPIIIKNTFNPTAPGTTIADLGDSAMGVSAIADTRLLTLEHAASADFYGRMVNAMTRNGIEMLMPDGQRSCGVRGTDAERAESILKEEFAGELLNGSLVEIRTSERRSMVALVGSVDKYHFEPSDIAEALNEQGIPVVRAPQRASAGSITCMVPAENLNDALITIHTKFINKSLEEI